MNTPEAVPVKFQKKHRLVKLLILLLILAGLGGLAWKIVEDKVKTKFMATSEYQAVFLTNGQVYFGKLEIDNHWLELEDIYYLQVTDDLQPASGNNPDGTPQTPVSPANDQSKIQLVKLGAELHGPQDKMFISSDMVIFWENMKDDSKVVQSIKDYKSKR